jgi:hypothetical protein
MSTIKINPMDPTMEVLMDLWKKAFPDVNNQLNDGRYQLQRMWAMRVVIRSKKPITAAEFQKQFPELVRKSQITRIVYMSTAQVYFSNKFIPGCASQVRGAQRTRERGAAAR